LRSPLHKEKREKRERECLFVLAEVKLPFFSLEEQNYRFLLIGVKPLLGVQVSKKNRGPQN
jgi:hypothetical protein